MPARRLLVLGATGRTGRHVVDQAVAKGLEVTALAHVQSPQPPFDPSVRVVAGDLVVATPDASAAFAGQDAVISALGRGQSFASQRLISRAAPAIVAAMNEHGVRRLVFTSAFGVGDTRRDVPLLPRLFAATLLRGIYADKAVGEAIIMASDLNWTIVYPAALTDGPKTDAARVGERLALQGMPSVSRADVAAVLLQQLDDDRYVRKGILVAN